MHGCNCCFITNRDLSAYGWLQRNCELALKKGMTGSARFKEIQYPRSLRVPNGNDDGTTQMYGCKCFFEMAAHLKWRYMSNT